TGTVTFVIDSVNQTPVTLSNGMATLSTSALAAGSHPVSAIYSGDDAFATSTATPLSQTVGAMAATTISLQSSGAPLLGQIVTFTATVGVVNANVTAMPTGTVTFSVDGTAQDPAVALASGVAMFSTSMLPGSGSPHIIGATYNGDSIFGTSSTSTLSTITSIT